MFMVLPCSFIQQGQRVFCEAIISVTSLYSKMSEMVCYIHVFPFDVFQRATLKAWIEEKQWSHPAPVNQAPVNREMVSYRNT